MTKKNEQPSAGSAYRPKQVAGQATAPGQEVLAAVSPVAAAAMPAPVDDDQLGTSIDFFEHSFIDDLSPRAGYTHKWVRVTIGGEDDVRNIAKQQRLGWQPRPLDTVGKGYSPPTIRHKALGNVIGVGDLVLFEMPEARAKRIREMIRQKARANEESVNANVERSMGGRLEVLKRESTTAAREPTFTE